MYNPKKTKKISYLIFVSDSFPYLRILYPKRLLTFAQFHIYKEDTSCTSSLNHINDT